MVLPVVLASRRNHDATKEVKTDEGTSPLLQHSVTVGLLADGSISTTVV